MRELSVQNIIDVTGGYWKFYESYESDPTIPDPGPICPPGGPDYPCPKEDANYFWPSWW